MLTQNTQMFLATEGSITDGHKVPEDESGDQVDAGDSPDYPGDLLQGTKLKAAGVEIPSQNAYVGKRNFIHQMMDVALMMANVSQLKALLVSGSNEYYYLILVVICLSIILQIVFTICMITIWSLEKTIEEHESKEENPVSKEVERKKNLASLIDRFGNVLVLGIIVSNVFITGFGVGTHTVISDNYHPRPPQFIQNVSSVA